MNIGKRYTFSLLSSFSGKLRLVSAQLVSQSDSSIATVTPAINEHLTSVYRLPTTLKQLDIYGQRFFHFREEGTDGMIIIPEAYINQGTIEETTSITRTLVFTVSTAEELANLTRILTENQFKYRVI